MHKPEAAGMQRMTRQLLKAVLDELLVFRKGRSLENAVAAVPFVVEQRMPDVFHVYPDLVRTARFQPAFEQVHVAEPLEYFVMGYGMLALRPVGKNEPFSCGL